MRQESHLSMKSPERQLLTFAGKSGKTIWASKEYRSCTMVGIARGRALLRVEPGLRARPQVRVGP